MEYEALDLKTSIDYPMKSTISDKKARSAVKKESITEDKVALTITKVEGLAADKVQVTINELVRENFDIATKTHKQKPSYFAKEFLKNIINTLRNNRI